MRPFFYCHIQIVLIINLYFTIDQLLESYPLAHFFIVVVDQIPERSRLTVCLVGAVAIAVKLSAVSIRIYLAA